VVVRPETTACATERRQARRELARSIWNCIDSDNAGPGQRARAVTIERNADGDPDVAFSVTVLEPDGGQSQISSGRMIGCMTVEYRRCSKIDASSIWSDKDAKRLTIYRPHREHLGP
jgi:hypothetical protein